MAVNERIKILLKKINLTNEEIGKQSNNSKGSISNFKAGRNKPNFEFLDWLFSEFPQLNAQWLFKGKEPMFLELDQIEFRQLESRVEELENLVQGFALAQKENNKINALQRKDIKKLNNLLNDIIDKVG